MNRHIRQSKRGQHRCGPLRHGTLRARLASTPKLASPARPGPTGIEIASALIILMGLVSVSLGAGRGSTVAIDRPSPASGALSLRAVSTRSRPETLHSAAAPAGAHIEAVPVSSEKAGDLRTVVTRDSGPQQASVIWTVDTLRRRWARAADASELRTEIEWFDGILRTGELSGAASGVAESALRDLRSLDDFRVMGIPDGVRAGRDEAEALARHADVLRYDSDPSRIEAALGRIADGRSNVHVDALLDAPRLPTPNQRRVRLHALWRMGVDTADPERAERIRDYLERARYASDPEAARIATAALTDWARLDASRADTEHDAAS